MTATAITGRYSDELLDYVPNVARELRVRHALSTSIGFGGHNTCLAIGALDRVEC
jgi:3-oxoacyl-(acyl-carrier-protein) synthase